ncbi:hypothetical protein [Methylobacterium oryzihabitans]|uniref:Uncharacterized protein n=1 Tax=Methylobacterium oryzihabitans TaxID=2499852 RepID=A0A3S2V5Z4_9HYPH|nr:hypothetical protein [Methylobacterium oryzihabitans]RVU15216.1 hypothetical protein EOE48_20630 [Methylobacterium oryzihabitans]
MPSAVTVTLTEEDRNLLVEALDNLIADWSTRTVGDAHAVWSQEDEANAAYWVPVYFGLRQRLCGSPDQAEVCDLAPGGGDK